MNRILVQTQKKGVFVKNAVLNDSTISLKAKGLYFTIINLPDDCKLTIEGLRQILKDGRDSISNAMKELLINGYCRRERLKNTSGKFIGYDYVFMI